MSLAQPRSDVDPITVQFQTGNRELKTRLKLQAENTPRQPPAETAPVPVRKVVKYGGAVALLLISVVSLIWIGIMAADGDSISRAALFITVNVLWFAIFTIHTMLSRDHHENVRQEGVDELRAEIRAAGLGQTAAVQTAINDFKVQTALLRAEVTAIVDSQITGLRDEIADYGERCDSEGAIRAHEAHQARAVVGASLVGSNVVAAQGRFRN